MTIFALFFAASLTGIAPDHLTVDIRTGDLIEQQWPDAETPIPVGSLVKPFLAMAYPGPFPDFECKGSIDGCWRAQGHGKLQFRRALAQSCNAYFLNLARGVDSQTLSVVAAKFGLPAPSADTPQARIGLGVDWKISPIALTRAYAELATRKSEPRIAEILAGLALAAQTGTASAIGRGYLAKTGTAPCVLAQKHVGDGFTVVLYPADAPRAVLLVRVHGVPGAESAKTAARLVHR